MQCGKPSSSKSKMLSVRQYSEEMVKNVKIDCVIEKPSKNIKYILQISRRYYTALLKKQFLY